MSLNYGLRSSKEFKVLHLPVLQHPNIFEMAAAYEKIGLETARSKTTGFRRKQKKKKKCSAVFGYCSFYPLWRMLLILLQDNRAVANFVGNSNKFFWIGLYCFSSSPSNCFWDDDSGSSVSYSNFAQGFPVTDVGSCVYYSVSGALTGQWISGDCEDDVRPVVCETPTTISDNYCSYNFNGNCYFPSDNIGNQTLNFQYAQSFCESVCGNLVSVHSSNEIRYLQNYYSGRGVSSIYLGAQTYLQDFFWIDGSVRDYNNIDPFGSKSGNCLKMSLVTDGNKVQGSWYYTDCQEQNYFICKRPVGTPCGDIYTTNPVTISTLSPVSDCNRFIIAPGTFTSPNYPGNYSNYLDCFYSLATLGSYRIRLTFNSFNTETCCDRVRVYDGNSIQSNLIGTFQGMYNYPIYLSSTGNTLYVRFTTDQSVVGPGFSAQFLSIV